MTEIPEPGEIASPELGVEGPAEPYPENDHELGEQELAESDGD